MKARQAHMPVLLLLATLTLSFNVSAQVSQVEYDIMKVRFAEQIRSEKFDDALVTLDQIRGSGYDYPLSLDYFEGFALQELGRLVEAQNAYKSYLEQAGSDGEYYTRGLQKIVQLDEPINKALEEYKKALADNADEETRARYELVLGARATPLKQEWQAKKDEEARQLRLAEEAEAARLEKLRQQRLAGTYQLTLDYGGNTVDIVDFQFINATNMMVVGDIRYEDCQNKKNNRLVMRIDLSGELIQDKHGCGNNWGNKNHAFFRDIHRTKNGDLIVIGTNDDESAQRGGITQLSPQGDPVWSSVTSLQNRSKSVKEEFGYSVFWGSELTSTGEIFAVGENWNKDEEAIQQRIAVFGLDGEFRWDNYSMERDGVVFRNVIETEANTYTVVGQRKRNEKSTRGYLEIWGLFMGPPCCTQLETYEDKNDTVFYDAAPAPEKGTIVIGTAKEGSGGQLVLGGQTKKDERSTIPYINHFDEDGDKEWSKVYPEFRDAFVRRIVKVGDNYLIVGRSRVDGDMQGLIFSINGEGDILWSRHYGGDGWQALSAVRPIPDGTGLFAIGYDQGNPWFLKMDNEGRI